MIEKTSARTEFQVAQDRLLRRHEVSAESHFLAVESVDDHVHVLKCGGGPPVVMVPGFGDPTAIWAPLMAELGGFSLYAVDRPCFGLTGNVQHTTETFRGVAVAFLEQVLDALGLERPLFIANSIGSLWSIWFALDRPDRVAAMAHIGCPAFILGTSAPLPLRLLSVRPLGRLVLSAPPTPRQVEAFGRRIGGVDLSMHSELRDLLVAAQKLPGAQRATLDLLHAAVRLRGARPEVALTAEQLVRIRQPVLLVWGDHDAFGKPEIGEAAARLIPDAQLQVVAGGGHVPWVGHPREVAAAVLPFLRAHSPSS